MSELQTKSNVTVTDEQKLRGSGQKKGIIDDLFIKNRVCFINKTFFIIKNVSNVHNFYFRLFKFFNLLPLSSDRIDSRKESVSALNPSTAH